MNRIAMAMLRCLMGACYRFVRAPLFNYAKFEGDLQCMDVLTHIFGKPSELSHIITLWYEGVQ